VRAGGWEVLALGWVVGMEKYSGLAFEGEGAACRLPRSPTDRDSYYDGIHD